jgi:hypothetical protein
MTVGVEEILNRFDRLPKSEKVEVAAAILQRLTPVFNQSHSDLGDKWGELVCELAGSWGGDFPSLEQIRGCMGQDVMREII